MRTPRHPARARFAPLLCPLAVLCAALLPASAADAYRAPFVAPSLTFSGVVADAHSGRPIANATVNARVPGNGAGTTVHADRSGRYQLRLAYSRQVQLAAVAIGYQWRVESLSLSGTSPAASVQASFDFKGTAGLVGVFLPAQDRDAGDTLTPFSQTISPRQPWLSFSGMHVTPLQDVFAVTYPDGNAAEHPLQLSGEHFGGRLDFDHGRGIYELEVNEAGGTAVFNLPIYYGVPPSLPPLTESGSPDNPRQSEAQARAGVLAYLNALRARADCAPLRESAAIDAAALAHSTDILQHPGQWASPHIGTDGSDDYQRLTRAGVPLAAVGEAMALQIDPSGAALWSLHGAIDGLMASPGHRLNLLFKDFDRAGIGVARDSAGRVVLTIDLAASATVFSLYGAIHTANGTPIARAPFTVARTAGTTDASGRFTLSYPVAASTLGSVPLAVRTNDGSVTFTIPLRGDAAPASSDGPVPYGPLQLTIT